MAERMVEAFGVRVDQVYGTTEGAWGTTCEEADAIHLFEDRSIRTPLRLSEGGTSLERPAERGPFRGEHTEAVLVELCGYSTERVRALEAAGVFGDEVAAA